MIEDKGLVRQCAIPLKFDLPYLASTIVSTSLTCDDGESSVSLVLVCKPASAQLKRSKTRQSDKIEHENTKQKSISSFFGDFCFVHYLHHDD